MRGVPLKRLSPNARILARGRQKCECEAEGKAQVVLAVPSLYRVSFHKPCQHNELVALHNRHLIDRTYIPFDKKYWNYWSRVVCRSWRFRPEPLSYMGVAMSYRGGKRRIYMKARDDLINGMERHSDGYVRMFVKPDRYPEDSIQDKMPRAIQYRHPRYNLQLATYLKPYEHEFYAHPGIGPSKTRVVTKGMNPEEIAKLFILKAAHFRNPVFLSCDHSKFDSTVREEHLRTEHRQYRRSYPRDGRLHKLLKRQLFNKGFSTHGVKYTIRGTRMSGDYNTGLGNCMLNRMSLESLLWHIKHEIMLDGDDSVVIVEADDLALIDMSHFGRMGFQTTIEINRDMTQVVYCQKKIVLGNTCAVMVRDPIRALSNMCVSLANVQGNGLVNWLKGVCECEYYCNFNMPLYKEFANITGKIYRDSQYYMKVEGLNFKTHTMVEREAFAMTWNIEVAQQETLERLIRRYFHPLIFNRITYNISKKDVVAKTEEKHGLTTGRYGYSAIHSSNDASWNEFSTERIFNAQHAGSVTAATPTPPNCGGR